MVASITHLVLITIACFVLTAQATFTQLNALVSRQTSGTGNGLDPSAIPTQCRSSCLPINALDDGSCPTLTCICSTQISTALRSCLQCLLNIDGDPTEVAQCQRTYNTYAQGCTSAGLSVPNFTCASSSSGGGGGSSASGGSTTGLGVITPTRLPGSSISSASVGPTGSSAPGSSSGGSGNTGSSGSGNSQGGGASGIVPGRNGALQSPMSGTLVLIGAIAGAILLN